MYEVDERDRVTSLEALPQSCVGAPHPFVIADEHRVVLAYYLQERSPERDGLDARIVDPLISKEPIAILRFNGCMVHMFGPPNDESFAGHPLAHRGLHPYGVFRIDHSSWLRRLERMNSIHMHHRAEDFRRLQHLVFAFHGSTFECICHDFDVSTAEGSIQSVISKMVGLLEWKKA